MNHLDCDRLDESSAHRPLGSPPKCAPTEEKKIWKEISGKAPANGAGAAKPKAMLTAHGRVPGDE
jgi:hypothetical protein